MQVFRVEGRSGLRVLLRIRGSRFGFDIVTFLLKGQCVQQDAFAAAYLEDVVSYPEDGEQVYELCRRVPVERGMYADFQGGRLFAPGLVERGGLHLQAVIAGR